MYNPYNWKMHKKEDIPKPKPTLIYNCALEELGYVSMELDLKKLEQIKLKKALEEVNEEIVQLERKKVNLFNKLMN